MNENSIEEKNHTFQLKKVLGEISEAKTAASNYDLVFDLFFSPFEFQPVTGVV